MNSNDFVLELEENALDSLTHGVQHYVSESEPTFLKYTVLHVFHAVELLLKARLANEHPLLIYDAPEKAPMKPTDNYRTVDFEKLITRLQRAGISIGKEDAENLSALRRVRNSMEHHRIEVDSGQVEAFLGKAMFFIDRFLSEELQFDLKERLDEETYGTLKTALYTYEQQIELAEDSIRRELPRKFKEQVFYRRVMCESCDNNTVLVPPDFGGNSQVECHYCNAKYYVNMCERCGSPMLSLSSFTQEADDLCEDCWDQILS